jgi:hypothetical protein
MSEALEAVTSGRFLLPAGPLTLFLADRTDDVGQRSNGLPT